MLCSVKAASIVHGNMHAPYPATGEIPVGCRLTERPEECRRMGSVRMPEEAEVML
jgi:hypothetical protein